MEKNVIVSDANGRRIGVTYPKRAKGLVKNGRAEYVNDQEIRLLIARLPIEPMNTEDTELSKIIHFNTREFELEDTCNSNVGFRGFVTTALGNEEVWEIGDWGWNWTQMCTEISGLEPNTDYAFRFAMTLGHNDDNKEESLVHILYNDGDATQAWKDRFTYCIRMSRFKPVLSKRDPDEDTMIRVFELPFNTGEHTDVKIIIVSQHAVARFFRARANEDYEGLEDLSYEKWRKERTAFLEAQEAARRQKMTSQMMNLPRFEGAMDDTIREMIEDAIEDVREEMADMMEDHIQEVIHDSISEFLGNGIEGFLASHPLAVNEEETSERV